MKEEEYGLKKNILWAVEKHCLFILQKGQIGVQGLYGKEPCRGCTQHISGGLKNTEHCSVYTRHYSVMQWYKLYNLILIQEY